MSTLSLASRSSSTSRAARRAAVVLATVAGLAPRAPARAASPDPAPPAAPPTAPTTPFTFEGEPGVSVRYVHAKGAAFGTSFVGGISSAYGESTSLLCVTPCQVDLPNGAHELKVGENLLFGPPFVVDARGTHQRWEVEDASGGLGVFGILGTGIGLGGAAGAGLMYAFAGDGDDTSGATVLLGASAALSALGIWALIEAFSDADRIE